MSEVATKIKVKAAQAAGRDERFQDLLTVTSMIAYCQAEVQAVSPTTAILLANSRQVLIAEINQLLAAALRVDAA
jgi:hypothetical protein